MRSFTLTLTSFLLTHTSSPLFCWAHPHAQPAGSLQVRGDAFQDAVSVLANDLASLPSNVASATVASIYSKYNNNFEARVTAAASAIISQAPTGSMSTPVAVPVVATSTTTAAVSIASSIAVSSRVPEATYPTEYYDMTNFPMIRWSESQRLSYAANGMATTIQLSDAETPAVNASCSINIGIVPLNAWQACSASTYSIMVADRTTAGFALIINHTVDYTNAAKKPPGLTGVSVKSAGLTRKCGNADCTLIEGQSIITYGTKAPAGFVGDKVA